jgi:hypothetical protein
MNIGFMEMKSLVEDEKEVFSVTYSDMGTYEDSRCLVTV